RHRIGSLGPPNVECTRPCPSTRPTRQPQPSCPQPSPPPNSVDSHRSGRAAKRYFSALSAMLTSCTRRFSLANGLAVFFSCCLPFPAGTRALASILCFSLRKPFPASATRLEKPRLLVSPPLASVCPATMKVLPFSSELDSAWPRAVTCDIAVA